MEQFNPMQYLAISIANAKGLDKDSWKDRIQWVKENADSLEELEPEGSDKFVYRKAVKAFRLAEAKVATGYIMDLDATNSGMQVMAVLGKCAKSAKTCNVINTGKREDLYGAIMDKLEGTNITRQQVKDAVIPMLYGSKAEPKKLFGEDTPELEAFYKAIHQACPILQDMQMLASSLWNPEATEHSFTMPDGHRVILPTLVQNNYRVRIGDSRVSYKCTEIGTSDSGISLLANIIHAVDGYIAREMVRRAKKQGFQLAHIHDSFWASPKYMDLVRHNYVCILTELAKSNLLSDIITELTGEEPELEFDNPDMWKDVMNAEYALS